MTTTKSETKYTGRESNLPAVYETGQLEPGSVPPAKPETMVDKPVTLVLSNPDGTPTREGWRKIGERFELPFDHKMTPASPKKPAFPYITARQVAERLDRVVGPGNWQTAFRIVDPAAHVVECMLTIMGVTKCDVGYPNSPGSDYETEPFKSAYSDAFKRSAVAWGIGRYLYGD